jgi:hypothetical protein
MPTRRVIKGVLVNFLGTYVSRNSRFGDFLLFGYLVDEPGEVRLDLLGHPIVDSAIPSGFAVRSAIDKFDAQRRKAGLDASLIRSATLTITRPPEVVRGTIGYLCDGFNVRFHVEAVMDNGRRFEHSRVEFIVPTETIAAWRRSQIRPR